VAHDTDRQATEDIDDHDQNASRGVAAHELAGTVHRAVEIRLGAHLDAAAAGFVLVDQASVQIGIDGHLLAGHRVEGEARADFGDAARTLGHHHEIDDREDGEHDDADRIVAADHELAEGLDHMSGGARALVAVQQHHAGRGDVERQPQQCGQQQYGREHRKVERPRHVDHCHRHQHRDGDVEGEQHVERYRRQRQDDHRQHRQQQQRRAEAVVHQLHDVSCGIARCQCHCGHES
jgi:hypothetical protein